MTLRRRRLFLSALAGFLATLAVAQAEGLAGAGPDGPIVALHDGLLKVMKEGASGRPFAQRFRILAPIIDRVFDLPSILRACVGPRWSGLPSGEKTALEAAFRQFTIASYVANFDNFQGERFETQPDRRTLGADTVVTTRILGPGSDVSRIDYVMRQVNGMWKAVDVLLDGTISRVAVQRSDFRNLLGTGDASALIASLERKAMDFAGGAATQ